MARLNLYFISCSKKRAISACPCSLRQLTIVCPQSVPLLRISLTSSRFFYWSAILNRQSVFSTSMMSISPVLVNAKTWFFMKNDTYTGCSILLKVPEVLHSLANMYLMCVEVEQMKVLFSSKQPLLTLELSFCWFRSSKFFVSIMIDV